MYRKFLISFVCWGGLFAFGAFLLLFSPVFTGRASAALSDEIERAYFLDADQIRINFRNGNHMLLRDNNTNDSNLEYVATNNELCDGRSHGVITLSVDDNSGDSSLLSYLNRVGNPSRITVEANVDVPSRAGPGSPIECEEQDTEDIEVDSRNARIYFRYEDDSTIVRVDNDSNQVYKLLDNRRWPQLFFRESDGDPASNDECVDFIQVRGSEYRLFDIGTSSDGSGTVQLGGIPYGRGCHYNRQVNDRNHIYGFFDRAGLSRATLMPLGGQLDDDEDGGGNGSGNAGENEQSCDDAGELSWILCPIVTYISGGLNWIDTQIQALLDVNTEYYDNEAFRNAFGTVRNLAYIILVPVTLVMVISTALGFEFVSAYTVKRALPRLLFAVVFIALSYDICVFMIQFINELGSAILGILTAPFAREGGAESLELANLFGQNFLNILQNVVVIPGLLIMLWLFGSTILLFAGIAFLVLLFRQMLIVVLIFAAPLAILAWIFPGNDKLWKLWWDVFTKALLMYPLIMAVLAVGRIFAFTIKNAPAAGAEGAILQPVMTIIAYTLPYAFIPFAFRFAGSAIASIGGLIDRNVNSQDSKRRRYAARKAKFERGSSNRAINANKYAPGTRRRKLADFANNVASVGTSKPWDTARIYARTTGGRALVSEIESDKHKHTKALAEEFAKRGINVDQAYRAISGTHKRLKQHGLDGPLRTQKDIDRAVEILAASPNVNDTVAASQLQAASGFIASAYKSEEYGRGDMQAAGLLGLASQGFANQEDVISVTNDMIARGDIQAANTIGNEASYMSYTKGRVDMKPTYGLRWNSTLNNGSGGWEKAGVAQAEELVKTAKGYEWTSAKGTSIENGSDMRQAFLNVAAEQTVNAAGQTVPTSKAKSTRQTIAQNATGAGDPGTKAKWREIAAEVLGMDVNDPDLDAELYYMSSGYPKPTPGQGGQPIPPAQAPPPGAGPPGAGPPNPNPQSDRRLKRNIEHISTTQEGIKLYKFQYLWSDQVYIGVMAQNLLDTYPQAVLLGSDGFYRVDYTVLGLEMLTLEQWEAQESSSIHA